MVKTPEIARGSSIPLPAVASLPHLDAAPGSAGELVAAFLLATQVLSPESAAEVAGVLPETIRKWRRRLPRWLKARTARCLAAYLSDEQPTTAGDPLQRAFRRTLRRPDAAFELQ
ncbi:MAG TPA: hypothetical protein VLK84_28270 [Longimicrobium sp.]|nr:hypothetical protein [Longimicrobium sp.]